MLLEDISVLYVEDEIDILKEIEFFLEKRVKHIYTAMNGEEGLLAAKKFGPDVILTDVQMPRLDGLGMIKKIREYDEETPIIITSAYNESDFLLRAINMGVDSYLMKPFDLRELLGKIQKVVEPLQLKRDLLRRNHDLYDLTVKLEDEVVYRTQRLEKERKLIKTIIDVIPANISWKDVRLAYQGANRYFLEEHGLTSDQDVIGSVDSDLYSKEKGLSIIQDDKKVIQSKRARLSYEETIMEDGKPPRYLLSSKVPLVNKRMEVEGIVSISQDITEQKAAQLRLKESQESLAEAQKIAHLGNWNWDLLHDKVRWNDELFRIFGEEPQSFTPTYERFLSYLSKNERHKVEQAIAKKLVDPETPYDMVHEIMHTDGTIHYVHEMGKVIYDEEGLALHMIGTALDVTKQVEDERRLMEQKNALAHQAHHDALTGLPNRVLFTDRLEQAINKAKRNSEQLAVFFIDLDHFKQINDSLGHEVGDEVLKVFAKRLHECVREEDTLSRMGGDEFMVIMEDLPRLQASSIVAQKIMSVMERPLHLAGKTLYLTSSIGISVYPQDGENSAVLVRNADAAMYKAKSEGRNTYQFYTMEMTELAFERVLMETNLRRAIEQEEFVVYYQPQVDARSDEIVSMEALVRWEHPELGQVRPAKFIPLAVDTGMITQLDAWVMKTAMSQMRQWRDEGLAPGRVALNLSMQHIMKATFIEELDQMLLASGCDSKNVELEITESQLMKDPQASANILRAISDRGISLAIDDFGTGYSSLYYLKHLPVDKLKLDLSFVRDLPDDEEDVAVAQAVIALASSLGIRVIAEGVETTRQRDFLVANGCHDLQGYLYKKPMIAEEMTDLLKARSVQKSS